MSSFEPDPIFAELAFRPGDLGTLGGAAFSAALAEARRTGGGAQRAAATGSRDACTQAQHAELEQAAFEKGRASAAVDAARCEQACDVLERAAATLERSSLRLLHESREAILALAAEIARRWIGEELRLDPGRLAGALTRALAACEGAPAARLHLSPAVLEALSTNVPEWLERSAPGLAVELVAAPELADADFRVETPTQEVRSGLESLAKRLRVELAAAFEADAPEVAP